MSERNGCEWFIKTRNAILIFAELFVIDTYLSHIIFIKLSIYLSDQFLSLKY